MKGTLYVIATPIGNLDDFSYRAIETLNSLDLIAVEDTRKSIILLNKYNIKKPLFSNHKFNELSKVKFFIDKLLNGNNVGLMSDYKKQATLIEYSPDYKKVREWTLYGCWISGISEDAYNQESGDKHKIRCTIQYDKAVPVVE